MLYLTEQAWASTLVGSGLDIGLVSDIPDDEAIKILRSIQWKLVVSSQRAVTCSSPTPDDRSSRSTAKPETHQTGRLTTAARMLGGPPRGQLLRGPCRPGRGADDVTVAHLRHDAWAFGCSVVVDGRGVGSGDRRGDERPKALVAFTDLVFGHIVTAGADPVSDPLARPALRG